MPSTVARAMESSSPEPVRSPAFDLALLSDLGTERQGNEDCCGHLIEDENSALFVVADGVGGYEGGEVASAMAVEVTINAYRDSPPAWGHAKRLHRAMQRANIEIHNRALAVPELRRMATTCTVISIGIDEGMLYAGHVGDCRLYIARGHSIQQISRDHTVVGERMRMGLISAENARKHPERSALSRSLGQELIASIDQISTPIRRDDRIIVCSDGLWSVIRDNEIERFTREGSAQSMCQRMIEEANRRGTADNLTVAVFVMYAAGTTAAPRRGFIRRIASIFSR